MDSYPGAEGYRYLFATLAVVGALGAAMAIILKRRMSGSLRDRIALQVSELDNKLGLEGEEKTFAKP